SPDECLARPQWFVLVALVALAQAGRPCTLRDLLNTCDVVSSASAPLPPPQVFQQQSSSSGSSNAGRLLRPIPDFFLDGGTPPPPPVAAAAAAAVPTMIAEAAAEACPAGVEKTGASKHARGMSGKGGRTADVPGSRGRQRGGAGAWEPSEGGEEGGPAAGGGEEGGQLEVTVYSHRVVGEGYGSHTEYTVLANASLPGFARREMEVARRFSDFRWLHSCFQAIPGVLVPPLPPSKWAGSSSRDFVAERMKGLQRYMTRVAQHPILSRHYVFQVFLEGTPRGLRAAKALLPARVSGGCGRNNNNASAAWGDTFSPSMAGAGGTPVSPALSSTPGTTPPDEAGFVRRRFTLGGADDMYVHGGGGGGGTSVDGLGGGGGGIRQGQRRSVSFGASSDESLCNGAAGGGQGPGWTGSALSVVANVGYEAYENYVSTSVSTSLTSIKGVLGAVKTRAKSAVGLGAGPAPIAVEPDPLYEAEVARIEELVAPVAGSVKIMESAAVLKRGVGYEMSRLGHYLTQVASLEDTDSLSTGVSVDEIDAPAAAAAAAAGESEALGGGISSRHGRGSGRAGGWAKAEQVLGQRMERLATAWLGAIDQEESDFLDPLREQLGYLGSAKEVHRGRGRALDALQAGNASLQRNKQRLHAARAQGDAHMASVSMGKMEAAEERMTCAHTRAGQIAKTFKGEAKRFHECRRTEGVLAVLELARAQAHFAHKANAAWKQVLEDINPTDDELRESQHRVRLPKREPTIGGGSRSGGGGGVSTTSATTVGVIGGWLGAAATVGLSTASAGLSTVTGVAGATASAGLSTVTGVAGAVAGRATAAGGAGGTGKSEDGAVALPPPPPAGRGPPRGVEAALESAAAANCVQEEGQGGDALRARGPVLCGAAPPRNRGGYGGEAVGGVGLASGQSPRSASPGLMGARSPAGVDAGDPVIGSGAAGAKRGHDELLRDVDVQQPTHPTEPSSSSSRHFTEGSWEMNLEAPPPETKERTAEPSLDAGGALETKSAGGDPPTTKGSTAVGPDEDRPEAGSLSRAATNSAAAKSRGSGSSTSGKQEGEDWGAAAGRWPEGTDGDAAVQLESLSLDDQTPTTASPAAGMPSQGQGNRARSADDSAAAGAV
ncbi:unnamed protein product, partial [Ectocarpus sp. 12 AP-2014]